MGLICIAFIPLWDMDIVIKYSDIQTFIILWLGSCYKSESKSDEIIWFGE